MIDEAAAAAVATEKKPKIPMLILVAPYSATPDLEFTTAVKRTWRGRATCNSKIKRGPEFLYMRANTKGVLIAERWAMPAVRVGVFPMRCAAPHRSSSGTSTKP